MKIQINIADNQVWIAADDKEVVAKYACFKLDEFVRDPNDGKWFICAIVQYQKDDLWHNSYVVKDTVFADYKYTRTQRISERNMLRANPRPIPDDLFDLLPITRRFTGAFNPHIVLPYSEDDSDV